MSARLVQTFNLKQNVVHTFSRGTQTEDTATDVAVAAPPSVTSEEAILQSSRTLAAEEERKAAEEKKKREDDQKEKPKILIKKPTPKSTELSPSPFSLLGEPIAVSSTPDTQ